MSDQLPDEEPMLIISEKLIQEARDFIAKSDMKQAQVFNDFYFNHDVECKQSDTVEKFLGLLARTVSVGMHIGMNHVSMAGTLCIIWEYLHENPELTKPINFTKSN